MLGGSVARSDDVQKWERFYLGCGVARYWRDEPLSDHGSSKQH
jgi:hypothetical protein